MKQRIADFIRNKALLQQSRHYLVALSGGADSVCLLLVLKQLGYSVEAIHCNFQLRGEESDRDESFCRRLCDEQQVRLHLVHFDTRAYAQLHKVSIETAARLLRYHHFAKLCQDLDFSGVCVAHHQDDVAETVLMNLIRGTGIKGLTGIKPLQVMSFPLIAQGDNTFQMHVIRPLLCVSRDEIEDFLKQKGQAFVTDSSNLVPDVLRNKIRLKVLPLLREINLTASRNIVETAENLALAEDYIETTLPPAPADTRKPRGIPTADVKSEYYLYRLLSPYGFLPSQIKHIHAHIDSPTGSQYTSATHILVFDRGRLIIEELGKNPFHEMRIPEEGTYVITPQKRLKVELMPRGKGFQIPRTADEVALDADKLKMPLTVRLAKEGDRFTPFGMKGTKLVSDFLTDQKLSLLEKRRQLIITDSTDRILWVASRRPDHHFRITDSTQTILRLTLIEAPE